MSQRYKGRFICQWKGERNLNTINSLAALLVEKKDEMKVVVLTNGTTKKKVCSYDEAPDECIWGYCDGHAVSMCYRYAVSYLITQMHKHENDPHASILKIQNGGYELKKDIKLHFFSTKMPCGFMAEENGPLLSWKVPFKEKPHCLKCSSIILIGANLGIQGFLSHLFNEPVYISSITIPKDRDVAEMKDAEKIKKYFENLLKSTNSPTDSDYSMKVPDVEIVDVDSRKLFAEYFHPCNDEGCLGFQISEKQVENEKKQATGAVVKGSQGIIYTEENKLGTVDFRERMELWFKKATKRATKLKVLQSQQLDLLKEAQQRLSRALNVDEALEKLKLSLNDEMEKKFPQADYQNASEMEQCRSIINQTAEHMNKSKEFLSVMIKRFDSRMLKESLVSINKNMKEFENNTKSIVDILTTHYCDYKETLDTLSNLLDKKTTSIGDTQFYLDLMSCEWARSLRAMDNDIKMGNIDT